MARSRSKSRSRSIARRARIARQFLRTHATAERIVVRRLNAFWSTLFRSVDNALSTARSPGIDVEQIFDAEKWRPLFNAALIPGIKTAIYTGVSFEAEWVESATGEKTRQTVSDLLMDSQSDSGSILIPKLQAIQQGNFSRYFPGSFSGGKIDNRSRGLMDTTGWSQQRGAFDVSVTAELEAEIDKHLRSKSVGVWSRVAETTRNLLRDQILRGLADGDSLKDLTARIKAQLWEYKAWEARRVARTETTSAMNAGQHAERNELGIEHKEWISTIDNRTRVPGKRSHYDHLSPAGQTTRNNVPFVVSGESLMFPGDVSLGASAGNIVNCRCAGVGAWPGQ